MSQKNDRENETPSDALKARIRARMNSGEAEIFYRENQEHRLYPFKTFNKDALPPGSGTFLRPHGLKKLWIWFTSLFS